MNILIPYGAFDGVGTFGIEHYKYLDWLHRDSLNALIREGVLNEYLRDVDRVARKRIRDYVKKVPYPDEGAPDFEGQYHRFLAVTNNAYHNLWLKFILTDVHQEILRPIRRRTMNYHRWRACISYTASRRSAGGCDVPTRQTYSPPHF